MRQGSLRDLTLCGYETSALCRPYEGAGRGDGKREERERKSERESGETTLSPAKHETKAKKRLSCLFSRLVDLSNHHEDDAGDDDEDEDEDDEDDQVRTQDQVCERVCFCLSRAWVCITSVPHHASLPPSA